MALKKPMKITIKILINIASFYIFSFAINYGILAMSDGKIPGWLLFPTFVIFGLGTLILNILLWGPD